MSEADQAAEQSLIQDLLRQRKSEARWKNIRFLCWFGLIIFLMFGLFNQRVEKMKPEGKHTALVRLSGMIAPGNEFSAAETIPLLEEAFSDKNATGVILLINSEGGTPVQAALIHDAILRYKKKYHKKVMVVGEDLLTSGAYYVAVAADKIYVNPNTLTGSIGVIMKGFGFVKLMDKIGIERRVYIAGNNKDRLDPYLPQNKEDQAKVAEVMNDVHRNFVQAVLHGRAGKIDPNNKALFSGDFWSGTQAVTLGLVDAIGDLDTVNQSEFDCDTTLLYEHSGLLKLLTDSMHTSFDHTLNASSQWISKLLS